MPCRAVWVPWCCVTILYAGLDWTGWDRGCCADGGEFGYEWSWVLGSGFLCVYVGVCVRESHDSESARV